MCGIQRENAIEPRNGTDPLTGGDSVSAFAAAPHVITYSLHPNYQLPEMTPADIDREFAQFEAGWEKVCNVQFQRMPWGQGRFKFVSRVCSIGNGLVALGLAHFSTNTIDNHNGTRNGGRTDFWRNSPGLLAACNMHELGHWIWSRGGHDGMGHSNDRRCIMHSDLAAREFCPGEVAKLQQLYGYPAPPQHEPQPLDPPGTFRIPAASAVVQFGDGRGIGLPGMFRHNQWGLATYDPISSVWHIKYSLSGGAADVSFQFGAPNNGMQPIVGDWKFTGAYGVGLYDSKTSTFYLRNDLAPGKADQVIQFGQPGSRALTGILGTHVLAVQAQEAQETQIQAMQAQATSTTQI